MKMDRHPELKQSKYDRGACKVGIVHLGYGAFHRAHQAWFVDQYMEQTNDLNWGIVAVNLRAEDVAGFKASTERDDGYVLKTISPEGEVVFELVRSHVGFEDWSGEADFSLIAQASVKVISMTVTESGYYLNTGGALDLSSPTIAAEIDGGSPKSIYGFLRAGLNARRAANGAAITILCCDNIRHNGTMLENNFAQYLKAVGDDALLAWVSNNATFPCSMVDRITPKPTQALSEESMHLFKRDNDATVMGEDFIQWVVEEKFATDFPALNKVGVTFTPDVTPYEETKIRVLNGGHTCLVYLGALMGIDYYDDLLANDELLDHYKRFETEEVLPALPEDLPFDKNAYYEAVTARFGNKHIADSVERICMDGFNKFPIFVLPTVRRCFELGIVPTYAIRSIASWYVFARNIESGALTFNYVEPYMDDLLVMLADETLDAFVQSQDLWGDTPVAHPSFASLLKQEIQTLGARWPA